MEDEEWCPRGIKASQMYTDPETGLKGREYLVMWEGSSEVSWIAEDYFKGGPYAGRMEALIQRFQSRLPAQPKPQPKPRPMKQPAPPWKGPRKKKPEVAPTAPPASSLYSDPGNYLTRKTVVDEIYADKNDAQGIFNKSLCQAARSGITDVVNIMLKDETFINQNLWVDDLTLAMCANHLDRSILMKITWFCRNIRIFFLAAFYDSNCNVVMDKDSLFMIIVFFLNLNKLKPGEKVKKRERILL